MDIRVLRYFLAVCREGTMSGAAKALHVTQPTLSRQIADLERELGCRLIERGGRQVKLTEKGIYLRRRAAEIVSLSDQTRDDLKDDESALNGEIRIAAGESQAIRTLGCLLRGLRRDHPGIRFSIHSGNAQDVAWRLDEGLADFAVFMSHPGIGEYDHVRLEQTDAWGLLMPEADPLSEKEAIYPDDLVGLPLIASESTLEDGPLVPWLGALRGKIDVIGTYSLAFNAAMLAKEGVGYVLMLDRIVPTGKDTGLEFRLLYPPVVSTVEIAWKRDATLSPVARKFLEALEEGDPRRENGRRHTDLR